jgi:exopolyphosphatase/guanosine-5'-triphosphate,3'-diphosphate pyrophosphatase
LKLFLVRHGKTETRRDWRGKERLRPLSDAGREEAHAIARAFRDEPISRIVCAPSLRCQQTVEELTVARGIPVTIDDRLGAGEGVERALECFPRSDDGPTLFCTDGELLPAILRLFELTEADIDTQIPNRKGSVWALRGRGGTPTSAIYFEPARQPKRYGRAALRDLREEEEAPRSVRAAVLDLGSTSFNLLIADVGRTGELRPVVRDKVMLRLGAMVANSGEIPKDVCKNAVEVAKDLLAVAEREKVQRVIPVATSALRDARNGAALAARIGRAIGTPVRILSGRQEAHLIFEAFQFRVAPGNDPVLGIDLGGGSLELAVGRGDDVDLEVTLPLGVARLHGELVSRDPMRKSEAKALRKRVKDLLSPYLVPLLAQKPAQAIATGGTIRALVDLIDDGRRASESVSRIRRKELRNLTGELIASYHDERLSMRGIRKRRADLLPTGAIVLNTLCEVLGLDRLTVSDWGLREGVLLDAFTRAPSSG